MRPRTSSVVTAILGSSLLLLGLLITGDFGKPGWIPAGYYSQGLGYSIFSLGSGSFLVYLFIEFLLLRERRQIGQRASSLIKQEIMGITSDIKNVADVSVAIFEPWGISKEEKAELHREAQLKEMERLARDLPALQAKVKQRAFTNAWARVFSERRNRLDGLEDNYANFLEAELVILLIDLQEGLDHLETHIDIVVNQPLMAGLYAPEVYKDIQFLLEKLANAARHKLVTLP